MIIAAKITELSGGNNFILNFNAGKAKPCEVAYIKKEANASL
jgi:hypothetical protein